MYVNKNDDVMLMKNTTEIAYIALGSNMENPIRQVNTAFGELDAMPEITLLQHSSLYQTKPVGYAEQPDFINAVAKLETTLEPMALLTNLLEIEAQHHRVRGEERNGPRTLDLDILLYGDLSLNLPNLTIPHPCLTERAFVLVPLAEIAPGLTFGPKKSISELLRDCNTDEISILSL